MKTKNRVAPYYTTRLPISHYWQMRSEFTVQVHSHHWLTACKDQVTTTLGAHLTLQLC